MKSDTANPEEETGDKNKPHYLAGNFNTKLSSYSNEEQDRIRMAFQPCGFQSIHSLSYTTFGSTNVQPGGIEVPPFKVGRPSPLFTNFSYSSEPYGLADELKMLEKKQQSELQQNIAGETPFIPASDRFLAKYEGMYKYVPEPADAVHDVQMRQKWLTEKKILGSPFMPPGNKALEKPTRALLTEILTQLYRLMCNDWEEAEPTVFTTEEDIIVIYFSLAHLPNAAGISAYMNVLAARNDIVTKYDLKKVMQGWGMRTEDNHLMFAFQPPWVRGKNLLAVSTAGGSTGISPLSNT